MTRAQFTTAIGTIATLGATPASIVRAVLANFANATHLTGDIKEIDCTDAYIAANFDIITGLGINERIGWAICDGQNGTKNRGGRVAVGYGTAVTAGANGDAFAGVFNSMGTAGAGIIGGSKDAIVPIHTHEYESGTTRRATVTASTAVAYDVGRDNPSGMTITPSSSPTVPTPVGSIAVTNKNLQPYIVSLFIQKL